MLDFDSFVKNKTGIYVPIRKSKGFCPNPVARDGIPEFADSVNNPNVVGTDAYNQYWDEQYDRCINGYVTGGINIPGRYYYFLNFQVLRGVYGPQYPWINDFDLEYYFTVDYIKKYKKAGMICLKARRKGLSEDFQTIANHGLRFIEGYRAGITAGLKTYADELRSKFQYGFDNVVPEMRLNYTISNQDTFQVGYQEKTETGSWATRGYGGSISIVSLQDSSEKMEGNYFNDIAMEEAGQYPKLKAAHDSIKPGLEFGSKMEGSFFIFGTAGNILSTSKDFKELWQDADTYDLVKLWVPGRRKYLPFWVNHHSGEPVNPKTKEIDFEIDPHTKTKIDPIKNLRKYKDYERVGMEDTEMAGWFIKQKKIALSKLANKDALLKFNKSYPDSEEEAWSSGGNNNFDPEILNTQIVALMSDEFPLKQYILDWVYTDEGRKEKVLPLRVTGRPAKHTDPDYRKHVVFQEPMPEFRDLDVGGVDSYNQDQTKTSNSLGSMIVIRRYKNLMGYTGSYPGEVPVHMYYKRPKRKEIFYEETLKAAIWYNLKRNTMLSAEYDNIINFWRINGGESYLSLRPRTFESKSSKLDHRYGAKMTMHSKPLALGIAQSWILDSGKYIFFPEILRDFLAYDEEIIESDWDGADACMLALMRIEDMKRAPRKDDTGAESSKTMFPEYYYDEDGDLMVKSFSPNITKKIKEDIDKQYIASSDMPDIYEKYDPFSHVFDE